MALDFPASPTDGQIYDNYYWDSADGVWNSLGNYAIPNLLRNGTFSAVASTDTPLTVQGTTSQSANLQNWKNSSGTTLASISSTGVPTFPGGNFNSPVNFNVGGIRTIELGGSEYGSIEIGKVDGTATTPYIDFHSSASASDYNARIIASGGTASSASGNLTIEATQLNLPTKTYAPGSIVQVQHVRTNSVVDVTAQDITAITGLSISFTPKFANSKILLTSMINSNAVYVTSYGFLKDGTSLGTTNPNANTLSSVWTGYSGGTVTTTNMYGAYTEWLENATNTAARTYAAGITSSWGGTIYTVRVNDRSDNVMRSYSSMTIYEIAQ